MRLFDLVGETMATARAEYDIEIAGLTCDSRAVEPGFLFAALPGSSTDGVRFIADAARNGAAALLGPPRPWERRGVTPTPARVLHHSKP